MVIAVAFGLRIGVPAFQQRAAISEMKQIGGKIYRATPAGPPWLRKIAGSEVMLAFDELVAVGFLPLEETFWERRSSSGYSGPTPWTEGRFEVSDSTLECIRRFPKLKHLDLSYTNVGDGGVAHIAALLAALKQLQLRETKITDEGAAELQRALPKLVIYRE